MTRFEIVMKLATIVKRHFSIDAASLAWESMKVVKSSPEETTSEIKMREDKSDFVRITIAR